MLVAILLGSALLYSPVRCNTTETTVTAATQRTGNSSASNGPAALAATELDILLPPADMADPVLVGVADVSMLPDTHEKPNEDAETSADDAGAGAQLPPTWLHSYDGPIIATATVVLLLMVALATHFLWRRHIERHTVDWETENTRILSSTSYYLDRSQIFVY